MFRRCRLPALFLATAALAGCFATINGRAAFLRGERAKQDGDLTSAVREYRTAVEADPDRAAYQTALANAQRESAAAIVEAARRAEAAHDWAAAIEQWDRAIELVPGDAELKARRGLAELRTKQADPVAFYRAAKTLVEAIPNDATAQATLQEAKKNALGYHLRLARVYADAESWSQAHQEYAVAKEIEPTHTIFTSGDYLRTRARHLEAQGDAQLAKGDALAAYESYEEASRLSQSRSIVQKMRRAKRGAGSMLEQLDVAKRHERKNEWEDAAEMYTVIAARRAAPVEVQDRARIAREKSAVIRSQRAEDYAARGFAEKAAAELALALEHTDAPAKVLDLLSAAVEELGNGAPGSAQPKVEAALAQAPGRQAERAASGASGVGCEGCAQAGPGLPVIQAAKAVMATVARVEFDAAKSRAADEPAEALVALRRLAPFATALPGYEAAKQSLVKRAFGQLLDRAAANAGAGRFAPATEQLATALEIAKAPAALAQPLSEGAAALERKEYGTARERFAKAVEADARSRLAKVGHQIATAARLDELSRQAAEARVVEDAVRAASAYRAILEIEPNDQSAKAGIAELKVELAGQALEAARDHEAAGRLGVASLYYRRVLDVDPEQTEAKQAVAKIERSLGIGTEPEAYVLPTIRGNLLGDACPGVEASLRDRLVLYLNRSSKLGAAFLDQHETSDVDRKTRLTPPVRIRSAVESCESTQGGQVTMTVQLLLGARVVMQERVTSQFDARSIPKDELAEGVGEREVLDQMIGTAAKEVSMKVKDHASALADWRTVEAQAMMQADDAEGVAQIYASLVKDASLSDGERKTVRELERFLTNRFR